MYYFFKIFIYILYLLYFMVFNKNIVCILCTELLDTMLQH